MDRNPTKVKRSDVIENGSKDELKYDNGVSGRYTPARAYYNDHSSVREPTESSIFDYSQRKTSTPSLPLRERFLERANYRERLSAKTNTSSLFPTHGMDDSFNLFRPSHKLTPECANARDGYEKLLKQLSDDKTPNLSFIPKHRQIGAMTKLAASKMTINPASPNTALQRLEATLAMIKGLPKTQESGKDTLKDGVIGKLQYGFRNSAPSPSQEFLFDKSKASEQTPMPLIDLTDSSNETQEKSKNASDLTKLIEESKEIISKTPDENKKRQSLSFALASTYTSLPSIAVKPAVERQMRYVRLEDVSRQWRAPKYKDENESKLEGLMMERRAPEKDEFPDRHRNPTTSTQVVLDAPSDPAQKKKITTIKISICYGTASFTTSEGQEYADHPLSDYVSILRESEADVLGCESHIVFRIWNDAELRVQSVLGSQKKFKQFSQDIHSISHLWKNGRISVELYQYSDNAMTFLSMYDFCEALFGQDRSILKCKVLEINWFGEWWPLSIIKDVPHHLEQLIFKIKQHRNQKLHHTFLDMLYEMTLPQHIDITLELNQDAQDFIDKLEKRFQRSDAKYFKFKFISFGFPPNLISKLLRNDYGTLEMTKVTSHRDENSLRRDIVIIEQGPHASVSEQQLI